MKQIENSKQYFEKEGRPAYINKVLADIEDGLSKGKQGKKLSKDNDQNLKTMKNKFKKYLT